MIRQIDLEYIAQRVQPIKDLYTDLEHDLIASIAKRIAKTNYITSSAAFEIEKLEQMRLLDTEAAAKIAAVAKKSRYMIEKLISDAGYFVLQLDEELYRKAYDLGVLTDEPIPLKTSPKLQTIMRGAITNAQHTMNFTNSQAHTSAQQAYYRVANKAYMETYAGTKSITAAIHDAVVDMAKAGITEARYIKTRESGKTFTRHDHIDVAVRRNIVTSVNQANGELCLARSEEWGNNLVEVSKHVGERPTHAVWSGKIYAIVGEEYGEYGYYANSRDVTGYGTAGGLKGVNCRHTFWIFIEGVSTPTTYPAEWSDPAWQAEKYKESQAQRKYEREIRSLKREIAGLDAIGEDHGLQSMKLRNKQNELKSFISQTGRTRRTNREQVVEFNRSIASKSTHAAKKLDRLIEEEYNIFKKQVHEEIINNYPLVVHQGQQDKHIIGTNNYIEGRSILTADAQTLIDLYAGKSEPKRTNSGVWNNKETFTHTDNIGFSVNKSGQTPTNVGTIHYSKKGVHIVPAKPIKDKR